MDPNTTLETLRVIVREIIASENTSEETEQAEQLAHVFCDLDEWLIKGGFLPKDWAR